MNLGLFVNDIDTEVAQYTTTRIARAAMDRDHDVYYMGCGDLTIQPNDDVMALSRRAQATSSLDDLMDTVKAQDPQKLDISKLDALVLRNDPSEDLTERPWAAATGIVFGHVVESVGAVVVNDPTGLAQAANKLYLQSFPREVRPKTLIGRDEDEIKNFIEDLRGKAVVKPLLGGRGESVFFVQGPDDPNVNQMVDAVKESGYVVVQEFLEEAEDGDVRFFLLDGKPLEKDGKYAAFRRRPPEDDLRSNMSAGGKSEAFEVTERELRIAELVGDKLAADGMFIAGLDIVGDKLVEVNVESPGGLQSVEHFTGVDFAPIIVEALERRVQQAQAKGR